MVMIESNHKTKTAAVRFLQLRASAGRPLAHKVLHQVAFTV